MRKPRIISPCVAERYNRRQDSRIVEFAFPDAQVGGLIEFRMQNGVPTVEVYRTDGQVQVIAPAQDDKEGQDK